MMNDSGLRRAIATGAAAALWLALANMAVAQAPVATVSVFADHYVLAGRAYDDLDRLEDAIAARQARGVQLSACGDNTSRAQLAAAHRFRNLYLDLRASGSDDAACRPATVARAAPVSQRLGPMPYGINDEAVGRWWDSIGTP